MDESSEILILESRISSDALRRLVREGFGDMVKYVADLERQVIAIGGQLHSDAEELLLESGSRSGDLWGANYYPGKGREECIRYTSLINIRPTQGNSSMRIGDAAVRERVRDLTFRLIGEGEEL